MKKVKWLERSLFRGGYLTFVTSQKEFEQALYELDIPFEGEPYLNPGANATTHSYAPVKGTIACIVALDMAGAAEQEPIDVAAILVHEAVHVWQKEESSCGALGCFGTEGEAYGIQNISAELMRAYKEKIK